jgi:hypothetical protein
MSSKGVKTMDNELYYESPDFAAILTFIDAIFSELNLGLFIYHVEDPKDISTSRLIYANKEASRCTGTDLRRMLGKTIFEAFPYLDETEAPDRFAEVIKTRKPVHVGVVEYSDNDVRHGKYSTRAFPMPRGCFGVIFEVLGD